MNIAIIGFNEITISLHNTLEKKKINDYSLKYIYTPLTVEDNVYKRLITNDYYKILDDATIDTIVDLSNDKDPYLLKSALMSKKNVVTISSSIIASNYAELAKIAVENEVALLFDAIIDIQSAAIHNLANVTALNKVNRIDAIIDAKSNYIISLMNNKVEYDDACELANQTYLYDKNISNLAILAMIGFSSKIDQDKIYYRGLDGLDLKLMDIFDILGYRLKMVSSTIQIEDDVELFIEPTLYKITNPMGALDYDSCAIKIYADSIGYQTLSSKATSTSCIGSIIHNLNLINIGYKKQFIPKNNYNCCGNDYSFSKYLIKAKDLDMNIVDKKIGDIYITKPISGVKIRNLKDKISFYARIE
jgi:homoserine dehydrogenase